MPRRKIERKAGGYCNIRKRGCSSSTSSSSLVKNYRLKRAILVGKKAGSSTPLPTWKIDLRSPSQAKQTHGGDKGKEAQMSARRLAATLWEINGFLCPADEGEEKENFGETHLLERDRKSVEKIEKLFGAELGETHLMDQSRSLIRKNKDGSKPNGHRRKSSTTSQKLQLTEYGGAGGGRDSVTNGASVEVISHSAVETTASIKTHLKHLSSSLTATKEIVKVLFRLWSDKEQNSLTLNLVSPLRVEIDQARQQVVQLIHEQGCNQRDVETLLKQVAAQKAAWKRREQDRILYAVSSVARELEIEKKLRRQSERLSKRLGRELADTKDQLSKAVKELDCERRQREILEQTCDELARGLGKDRAKVVELKRESAKVREEVERERKMLQLADVLREERVQMKLAEARHEYEEKNAALERLRSELEAYLGRKESNGDDRGSHDHGDIPSSFHRNKDFADFLKKIHCEGEGEEDEGEDSGDSELQSIELNMDSLSKSYKWSFENDGGSALQGQADSRRASIDEVFKGRRSLSEKIQWANICLQRQTSDGIEWDFTTTNIKQGNANGFDKIRLSGASSQGERNDHRPIKGKSPANSMPEYPLGEVSQGNSKSIIVNSEDPFDGNHGLGSEK